MVEAILDAVERFDDDVLEEQLRRVILLGSAGQIFVRVLAPVLITIGDRWHAGELTVAQEHYASQKLGAVLHDLIRLSPGTEASDCVILGCFADEEHEIGLLGFALRVSEWGARPIFLGARTPPFAVRSAVVALSPKLVALSVSVVPPRARARELIEEYAGACGAVPWIVGGAGSPSLADLIAKNGGLLAPEDPSALRALVQPLLVGRAPHAPKEKQK
jgi:methanogenic corrinoid protein MtbC1